MEKSIDNRNHAIPSFTLVQKINFVLFILLIAAGTVLGFDMHQRALLGCAGLLSLWAALTSKEYISYGINLILGLMLVFSAYFSK